MIERCSTIEHPDWLSLREALWPDCDRESHREEMSMACDRPDRFAAFVARDDSNEPVGLVEAAIRNDYVNGTKSSPVAFLEGIYVSPSARQRGFARALVAEVSRWAADIGCTELASDAALGNSLSQAVHHALGFEETERVVYFRRPLV